jgi:Family of unknown function (DUF6152)
VLVLGDLNMKSKFAAWLALGAGSLLMMCAPLFAHHGTASSYDASKAFTVQATVTEFHYANPHPQLFFDVKDEKGNVTHWAGEIAPNPAQLVQDGWGRRRSEEALAPGTAVTLTLAPSRAGTSVALVEKIVNAKGEEILGSIGLGGPPRPATGAGGTKK